MAITISSICNSGFAPLRRHTQEVTNNPTTTDINDIIADLKTVLKALYNKIKQILMSAVIAVDSNGTLINLDLLNLYIQIHSGHIESNSGDLSTF